ncbi:hypothetical protein GCM10009619_01860 [Williamsia maris]|uniref:Uncharacterized protein n=1 Tax=Williamsia maris TaxID=72806 RepID=A0ABT1H8T5_9NOCA|nr:hypothetical protein [Williamsia maris]
MPTTMKENDMAYRNQPVAQQTPTRTKRRQRTWDPRRRQWLWIWR